MTHAVVVAALALQAAVPQPKFDSGRAWEHLRQLVAIGPRPSGSPAIEQTRKYIKSRLAAEGLVAVEQAWDQRTPIDTVHMVNLIVSIPGTHKDRLVISGHYDTKLTREFRFVGASDGGSSAAFLIEMARVLKSRKNAMTIDVVFLDGEEARLWDWQGSDNTYGSRHYVETARHDGSLTALKAMLLVDMIGDRDLLVRRDENSTPWLTDLVWGAAKRLELDTYFVPESTRVEDDHLPFLAAGVPSIDIIDLDYEPWHTAKDTLDAVSARSLQVVGDVVLAALPQIEARFTKGLTLTGRRLRPRRPYVLTAVHHKMKKGHRSRRVLNSEIAVVAHPGRPLQRRRAISIRAGVGT